MWRSRAEGRPADSIKQFHRHLRVLNGTEPHGYSRALTAQVGSPVITAPMTYRNSIRSGAEMRRQRTLERRRNVLFTLTGLCVGTLLMSFVFGSKMLLVNVVCDLLLAAYVATLVHLRNAASERSTKLRYLPRQERVLDLREAASSSFYDEVSAWGDTYATAGAH
ncbi:MAG TPA: hypothetical protein VHC63_10940 [Acidimicrobiales bacterium]|nr:hypothetical protein [Acidimicrobiales bacterium]